MNHYIAAPEKSDKAQLNQQIALAASDHTVKTLLNTSSRLLQLFKSVFTV